MCQKFNFFLDLKKTWLSFFKKRIGAKDLVACDFYKNCIFLKMCWGRNVCVQYRVRKSWTLDLNIQYGHFWICTIENKMYIIFLSVDLLACLYLIKAETAEPIRPLHVLKTICRSTNMWWKKLFCCLQPV